MIFVFECFLTVTSSCLNTDSISTTGTPAKVILWSTPRSLSTVFTKCISFIPNSLIWYEPFLGVMFYGLDSRCAPIKFRSEANKIEIPEDVGFDATKFSYKSLQRELQADFSGKSVVFVQGKTNAIDTRFDAIPSGYKHSFLIRHPQKVLLSWKKAVYDTKSDGPYGYESLKLSELSGTDMPTSGYFFKETYELYMHIKDKYDPNPIVIDADDLQRNPGGILKAYCAAVGIPYTDDLLQWDSSDDIIKTWKIRRAVLQLHQEGAFPFLDKAFQSSEFMKLSEEIPRSDLSEDDLKCIDFCLPFYEEMHKDRLTC